jgi:hypothetical protein
MTWVNLIIILRHSFTWLTIVYLCIPCGAGCLQWIVLNICSSKVSGTDSLSFAPPAQPIASSSNDTVSVPQQLNVAATQASWAAVLDIIGEVQRGSK